jgi:hypothetical protein
MCYRNECPTFRHLESITLLLLPIELVLFSEILLIPKTAGVRHLSAAAAVVSGIWSMSCMIGSIKAFPRSQI